MPFLKGGRRQVIAMAVLKFRGTRKRKRTSCRKGSGKGAVNVCPPPVQHRQNQTHKKAIKEKKKW